MGDQKAEGWIQGMKANLARPPKGGDTDQIKAVASGECTIGVTNSYYLARMMRSGKPEDQADRKSTRLNSSHLVISYAVFCLKKKNTSYTSQQTNPHRLECIKLSPHRTDHPRT